MYQRREDYILRMAKQMTAVLAQLFHLKQAPQAGEALLLITETTQQYFGLSIDMILRLPFEHLMVMLNDDTLESKAKSLMLAQLLKESGDIYEVAGKIDDSYQCYVKSFNIAFEVLYRTDSSELESLFGAAEWGARFSSLKQVVENLSTFELPDVLTIKMISYYEQTGAYAQAEDLIFETLESTEDRGSMLDAGIQFYRRLRLRPDTALEAGNLPRDEVEAGMQELVNLEKGFGALNQEL